GRSTTARSAGTTGTARPPGARSTSSVRTRAPYREHMSADELIATSRRLGTIALVIAGAGGALVVLAFLTLVLPAPSEVPAGSARAIRPTAARAGLGTRALPDLLVERSVRGVAARALAADPPMRPVAPGVVARAVLAWALATGVPVAGIAMVAFGVLKGDTP